MTTLVRNAKDFWAGTIYVAFGGAAVWLGRDYPFGTGARMGPGYFPSILGGLLVLLGAASLARSFLRRGEPIGAIAWRSLALIIGATVMFGVLLPYAGLVAALLALVLISAAASDHFRFDARAAAGLIVLIAACAVVFVKALGVPMPLLGSWFSD